MNPGFHTIEKILNWIVWCSVSNARTQTESARSPNQEKMICIRPSEKLPLAPVHPVSPSASSICPLPPSHSTTCPPSLSPSLIQMQRAVGNRMRADLIQKASVKISACGI